MESKTKKILTCAVAGVTGVAILAGTLTYFTDREERSVTINTAGSEDTPAVDIVIKPDPSVTPDDPTLPPFEDPTPEDDTDDLENWWKYVNSKAMANFGPGDKLTFNFKMDNGGALAVDLRESFTLTSSEPLSEAPEFRLYSAVSEDGNGSTIGEEVLLEETRVDATTYKYAITPYTLSGAEENVVGSPETLADKEYYLVFDKTAANAFQEAECQIDYVAEAKQHTGSPDWSEIATAQLTVPVQE